MAVSNVAKTDWGSIATEEDLYRTVESLTDSWQQSLSDEDLEAVLTQRNEIAKKEWLESDEGRYRTLAAMILGREPKGIPLPQTLTVDGLPELSYPRDNCGLTPEEDSDLWLKISASLAVDLGSWRELKIDERLPLLEAVRKDSGQSATSFVHMLSNKKSGTPTDAQRNAVLSILKDVPTATRARIRSELKDRGISIGNDSLSSLMQEQKGN